MQEFDENKAIEAIKAALPGEAAAKYTDDQLLNIIDMIWDFYEENGLLDIDADEDMDDENAIFSDLMDYVRRMLKKDKAAGIDPGDVETIVQAEIDYENSLDPFA